MKQKDLEMFLQRVPLRPAPDPTKEQYQTPATIAADVVFLAALSGDIGGKAVLDLGCGTGIFAAGASLAGAQSVVGIDSDAEAIALARAFAAEQGLAITFEVMDIKDVAEEADTVLMNPPFGAQKANENADRRFLEKGFELAKVLYTLHLKKTIPFLETLVAARHGHITYTRDYAFPIPRMFSFHTRDVQTHEVSLLRIDTGKNR